MKKKGVLFLILIPFILISCTGPAGVPVIQPSVEMNDFAYVINGAVIADILSTSFDMVVIDYSRDGTEGGKYSPTQIQALKNAGIMPAGYFSIGEAEDYRYYWQSSWDTTPPSWLGVENPNWEGNYKVRYWQQEWQDILYDYLDKILDMGFNALMLDIVDAYYYWSVETGEVSEVYAATEMIDLVYELYTYAVNKTGNPDFMVFPQNAVEIIDYDTQGKYINTITGLSIESLFYRPNGNETNRSDRENRLDYLQQYKNRGKVILNTDYVYPNIPLASEFYAKSKAQGFIPYAADRSTALDEIILIDGLQPVD